MKTIVIDLPSGLVYPSSVLSAFKVYVKKNHFYDLLVCGDPANFSILEDTEGITCSYSPEGETSTTTALKALRDKENIAGLLSFADRLSLLEEAKNILPKNVAPTYGAFVSTKSEGKLTFLLEASGLMERNEENVLASLSYGKDYLLNVLAKPTVDSALLGMSEVKDPLLEKLDESLKKDEKNYHGLLAPNHLFDGAVDLVLAAGADGAFALQAAKGASMASKEMQKVEASKSWTSLLGRNKETEKPRFDSRIDQRGYLLFGFGKNILALNKDSGYGDVIDSLPVIEHLAFKKPFQK